MVARTTLPDCGDSILMHRSVVLFHSSSGRSLALQTGADLYRDFVCPVCRCRHDHVSISCTGVGTSNLFLIYSVTFAWRRFHQYHPVDWMEWRRSSDPLLFAADHFVPDDDDAGFRNEDAEQGKP